MYVNAKLLIGALLLITQVSLAASPNRRSDPKGDVDHNPKGANCVDLQTDIISTNLSRNDGYFMVEMQMSQKIEKTEGYKEYYFWLDVTHDSRNGFQPYMPDDVAWPNFYADYRIFYSIDAKSPGNKYISVRTQDCKEHYCGSDDYLEVNKEVAVGVDNDKVYFVWPVGMFPEMEKAKQIRVGYTTYYEKIGRAHV